MIKFIVTNLINLSGLFVYVDVRSGADGCENRNGAISHQLTNLGATVRPSTLID